METTYQSVWMDRLGRPLRDLRISVTDRCNFRCTYCMPKEVFGTDYAFLPHADLLTFEEIERLVRILAAHGVQKIRLTGGEPLLRRDLDQLIAAIAKVQGIDDIALTTNGSLLTEALCVRLRHAGLRRITVSLDAMDDDVFMKLNDVRFPAAKVLQAIDIASAAGLAPVKINMVVKRGVNEDQILKMCERFRWTGQIVRFIEYMDVGHSNGWRLADVVPANEIIARIGGVWELEPVPAERPGDVAVRYRYRDGAGEIGVIASVTHPFCGNCTRLRLTADGQLYTCLFGSRGHDVRTLLRSGASDAELAARIGELWGARADRYSELRTEATPDVERVEMSKIGG